MLTVYILEKDDIFHADDWCRPMSICSMSGGISDGYSFKNMYSGRPENNVKWVKVKNVIGKCWHDGTVGAFTKAMENCGPTYEFIRGNIPKNHQLDMRGYNTK